MSKLKKLIVKLTANNLNYETKLAQLAGYKKGNTINKFKLEEARELANFEGLICITKEIAEKSSCDYLELLVDYSKTIDPNRATAKCMLEYFSVNRLLPEMKNLLNLMKAASNKESKEWYSVYSLLYKWQTEYDSLDSNQFISDLNSLTINDNTLKICADLLRCNVYYNKMNFKLVYEISQNIEAKIQEISQSYIKTTYAVKAYEFHSLMNLWVKKDYLQARKEAEYILEKDIGETFNGQAHYVCGCSYFYESYEDSLRYLEKSHEIYTDLGRQTPANDVKERIQLLNCYWNKELNSNQFITPNLLCDLNKGKDIHMDLKNVKGQIDKPFYNLLKGLNEKNKDSLLLSAIQFLKNGDAFNANYPKVKLLNMGFSPEVLDELLMIHVN